MFSEKSKELVLVAEKNCTNEFNKVDEIAFTNQLKVLEAFKKNRVSERHFNGTTGYGYGDCGRDTLCNVYADVFGAESAIVTPYISCGTQALSTALYGILRPGDTMLSVTGKPYDTLDEIIFGSADKKDIGSLKDFKIKYEQIDLVNDKTDNELIAKKVNKLQPKLVFIQRSRGYAWRKAMSIADMKDLILVIKKESPDSFVMVDNCYGEFTETFEPTNVGADIAVGSLMKNCGGGLTPCGAYIAGTKLAIDLVAGRFTTPSLKQEVSSYEAGYRLFYQGLFISPHTVAQALKGSLLLRRTMKSAGYEVCPEPNELSGDIVSLVKFNTKEELIAFCRAVQSASPVDSDAVPMPWDMPGYNNQVIMAAGTFVQGATLELSCDSPIRSPYIAYLQGGLTYEHVKIATMECLTSIQKQ